MAMTLEKLRTSITGKILFIGLLVLVLLIPMNMVESVISERSHVYRSAQDDITGSWGKEISLVEPVLTVEQHDRLSWSHGAYTYDYKYRHLAPEKTLVNAHIETQIRKRGIFRVPVYTGKISIKGRFSLPTEENTSINIKRQGKIQLLLDTRSLRKPPELTWNGEKIQLTPEKSPGSGQTVIFHARLENLYSNYDYSPAFELSLELTGSNALTFLSRARQNDIRITSNWDSPGFFGSTLPSSHDINNNGFTAEWNTNNFFENLGHENSETISKDWFSTDRSFGVKFIQTVDTYQLVTRATKYAVLFITLIFAVYLLYEIIGNVILHPIQYLFIGFSNCIFYLLLLSLAEHIEFNMAFFTSAFSSVMLVALYSASILRQRARGILIFIKLSILYSFLFVTLKSEDYALLIGSIGLFTILSLIMYFTRNFNWYKVPAGQT